MVHIIIFFISRMKKQPKATVSHSTIGSFFFRNFFIYEGVNLFIIKIEI